jgi:hypothetical protein
VAGARVVGVEAELGRQVEGDADPAVALGEQEAEALVRLGGAGVAAVEARLPGAVAVSLAAHVAGVGVLAGVAELLLVGRSLGLAGTVLAVDLEPRLGHPLHAHRCLLVATPVSTV